MSVTPIKRDPDVTEEDHMISILLDRRILTHKAKKGANGGHRSPRGHKCLIVIETRGYHFTARNKSLNGYFFPAGSQRWETPAANLYLMGASEPMTFRSLRGISLWWLEEKWLPSKPGDKKDPPCVLTLLHKHWIVLLERLFCTCFGLILWFRFVILHCSRRIRAWVCLERRKGLFVWPALWLKTGPYRVTNDGGTRPTAAMSLVSLNSSVSLSFSPSFLFFLLILTSHTCTHTNIHEKC